MEYINQTVQLNIPELIFIWQIFRKVENDRVKAFLPISPAKIYFEHESFIMIQLNDDLKGFVSIEAKWKYSFNQTIGSGQRIASRKGKRQSSKD